MESFTWFYLNASMSLVYFDLNFTNSRKQRKNTKILMELTVVLFIPKIYRRKTKKKKIRTPNAHTRTFTSVSTNLKKKKNKVWQTYQQYFWRVMKSSFEICLTASFYESVVCAEYIYSAWAWNCLKYNKILLFWMQSVTKT